MRLVKCRGIEENSRNGLGQENWWMLWQFHSVDGVLVLNKLYKS